MEYKINLGIWNGVFCVPNAVADNYLKLAGESDIKVLLFLLRNAGAVFDEKYISLQLMLSTEQIEESIDFWKQRGVIEAEGNGGVVSQNRNIAPVSSIGSAEPSKCQASLRKIELERTPDFPPKEIAQTVRANEEANYLFRHCEALYGRPLKHNEQRTLMIILEDVCLPVETALILIDYCFSVKKATPAYMRTLALDWVNSDIITIEKAEERVLQLQNLNSAIGRFKKMFEITSAFSKQQQELINKWVNVYCFDDEMINEAYQLTLNGAGKLAFPYMNKILESWHDKGIKTVKQFSEESKPSQPDKAGNSSFDAKKIQQLVTEKYKKLGGDL